MSVNGPGVVPTMPVYGGDPWSFRCQFKDDTGTAVDLTNGYSEWRAQWRPAAGSGVAIDLTVDVTSAATGWIGLAASSAQTESMGGGGVWDLQAKAGAGDPVTWLRGTTSYVQGVTR